MLKLIHKTKAQSFLEYTMLIMAVSLALIAMFPYMSRAINARLKQAQLELDETKR